MEGIETLSHQGRPRKEKDASDGDALSSFDKNTLEEINISAFLGDVDHDYGAPSGLSRFSEDVVAYIGGYIVRIVSKQLTCDGCLDILLDDEASSILIIIKDNGGLLRPSSFVIRLLCSAEEAFRLDQSKCRKLSVEGIVLKSFKCFIFKHGNKLRRCQHYLEEPNHILSLAKVILRKYVNIRLREHARRVTEAHRGVQVRQMLTKQILFRNQ